jgi:hypothetical protein
VQCDKPISVLKGTFAHFIFELNAGLIAVLLNLWFILTKRSNCVLDDSFDEAMRRLQSIYLISFSRLAARSVFSLSISCNICILGARRAFNSIGASPKLDIVECAPAASPFSLSRRRKKSTWLARRGCNLVMGLPLLHISHSLSAASFIWGYTYPRAPSVINHIHSFVDFLFSARMRLAKGKQRFFLAHSSHF